jgi:hypothetical protein
MLVFGGYAIYATSSGFDFNHRFLGVVRGNERMAIWPILVFLELQLVAIFIFQRFSDDPETFRRRLAYILWGILGLFLTVVDGDSNGMHAVDHILGFYVWASDIAYGAIGSNDA